MTARIARRTLATPCAVVVLCGLATSLLATPVPVVTPLDCQECLCAGFHKVGTWQTAMSDGTDWKQYYLLDGSQQEIPSFQAMSTDGRYGYTDGQDVPNGDYTDPSCYNQGVGTIPPTEKWKCEGKPITVPPPGLSPSIFYHTYDTGAFVCKPKNAVQGDPVTAKDLQSQRTFNGAEVMLRCHCENVPR